MVDTYDLWKEALLKLSPEDFQRLQDDMMIYGSGYIRLTAEGATYVPVEDVRLSVGKTPTQSSE